MGLVTAQKIREAHYRNECQNFIVYGPLGYGKTSYAVRVLMEVYKTADINVLKKYYAHTPIEVLALLQSFDKQVPAIVWDDAGVWLYYMDYANPLVKHFGKHLQMVRTKTASIIFTTPNPTLILGKLRNFPQTLTLKVAKVGAERHANDRRVTAYQSFLMPDLQKLRVKKLYIDDFNIMLPNDVYTYLSERRGKYVAMLEKEIESSFTEKMKSDFSIV